MGPSFGPSTGSTVERVGVVDTVMSGAATTVNPSSVDAELALGKRVTSRLETALLAMLLLVVIAAVISTLAGAIWSVTSLEGTCQT